ncbi:hypothetical protein BaRGS_00036446 [Batillaria attramentaria]|uniref:TLC domain-containing protein n=1 Tax=Batillaria attramentaria TaxID=370345 RepID=A0ABD0JBR9_9CAEN
MAPSLLLAGCIFFPLLYTLVRKFLTTCFGHRLKPGDIFLISEKCLGSTQACLSFAVGAVIVTSVNDIMEDRHWLTNAYAWFAVPYFLYDIWAMYYTFIYMQDDTFHSLPVKDRMLRFARKSVLLLIHHTVLPFIIFPIIIFYRRNLGDFFVGTFYMIEMTIPFIAAREVLVQLKLKDTPYYIVAGLLMVSSFFVTRILVFPYLYWRYSSHAGIPLHHVFTSIPIKCNLGCLTIALPQFYWFGLMVRGTVRVLYKMYTRSSSKTA